MKHYVVTYGIACIEENYGKRELVTEISGVTSSLADAERLARVCNEQQLNPDHLKDVVDDLIHTV